MQTEKWHCTIRQVFTVQYDLVQVNRHPNIVTLLAFFGPDNQIENITGLVAEWSELGNLLDCIASYDFNLYIF